jgi:hypothetical protein
MKLALAVGTIVAAVAIARPALAADPCSIVSLADASKAIGSPVTRTVPRLDGPTPSCSYKSGFKSFVVDVITNASPSAAKDVYHQMLTSPMTAMPPSVDLPGIGDAAHRMGQMVYVLKGSTIYSFALVAADGNGAGALRTIAAAKSSIARLH